MKSKNKILFLNQVAGPLFYELAEDLASAWSPSLLFTGKRGAVSGNGGEHLRVVRAPSYDRANNLARLISWVCYFLKAIALIARQRKECLLLFVSNPPFLSIAGVLFSRLRGQHYAVLVYDIYPDVLVGLGRMKNGVVARLWDAMNRSVYRHASRVFVIGRDMARKLEDKIASSIPDVAGKISYIPCWADSGVIKPIPRRENSFARLHDISNEMVVLYSGNMGNTHNIEGVVEAARILGDEKGIRFMFIGDGAKRFMVEQVAARFDNVTLLPFQPADIFPLSISSGDVGVVSYQHGAEGCMVPSKAYYYMAAGLALMVVSDRETELTEAVVGNKCGLWVRDGSGEALADAIMRLYKNPDLLRRYKNAARRCAVEKYSRGNTAKYADEIKGLAWAGSEAKGGGSLPGRGRGLIE